MSDLIISFDTDQTVLNAANILGKMTKGTVIWANGDTDYHVPHDYDLYLVGHGSGTAFSAFGEPYSNPEKFLDNFSTISGNKPSLKDLMKGAKHIYLISCSTSNEDDLLHPAGGFQALTFAQNLKNASSTHAPLYGAVGPVVVDEDHQKLYVDKSHNALAYSSNDGWKKF